MRSLGTKAGCGVLIAFFALVTWAQTDSLGATARQQRKNKEGRPQATKVFTNDNLPSNGNVSTVGNAPAETPSADQKSTDKPATSEDKGRSDSAAPAKPGDSKTDAKPDAAAERQAITPQVGDDPKERQAKWQAWQKRVSAQKEKIQLMQRELDVSEREYRLRAAAFYGDAGNRLRNQTQWAEDEKNYKQQTEQKRQDLEAAKQDLDKLLDEARRAGVPSSFLQ